MKAIMVPVGQLKVKTFVRKELNVEYTIQLSLLYESGKELPPLEIEENYTLVEGRHRLEAAKLAGLKEVPCIIVPSLKPSDMIIYAFSRNVGGCLPPTKEDINFTMESLLENGMSTISIIRKFDFWPADVVRRYVKDAHNNISQRKLRAAVKAVAEDNLRISDAAHKFGVDPDKLKQMLGGKKKKGADLGINVVKGQISSQYRSHGQHNAQRFTKLFESFRNGEISAAVVDQAFEHTRQLIKRELQLHENRWQRWDALQQGVEVDAEDRADTAEVGGYVL